MIIYKRFLAKLFVNRLDHAVFGACVYLFLTFHLTKRVIVYFYSKLNRILLTTHVKSQHTCCYNLLTGLNNVLLVNINKVDLVSMNNVDEEPTLDFTIRFGSTPTFSYFDLYLYSVNAAHYVC